jgi:hypothetical protein
MSKINPKELYPGRGVQLASGRRAEFVSDRPESMVANEPRVYRFKYLDRAGDEVTLTGAAVRRCVSLPVASPLA